MIFNNNGRLLDAKEFEHGNLTTIRVSDAYTHQIISENDFNKRSGVLHLARLCLFMQKERGHQ